VGGVVVRERGVLVVREGGGSLAVSGDGGEGRRCPWGSSFVGGRSRPWVRGGVWRRTVIVVVLGARLFVRGGGHSLPFEGGGGGRPSSFQRNGGG
jgi:hypothetical protein